MSAFITQKKTAPTAPRLGAPTPSPSLTGASTPQRVPVAPERIRARAYEIYLARRHKGVAGDALSDWLQAERELTGNG